MAGAGPNIGVDFATSLHQKVAVPIGGQIVSMQSVQQEGSGLGRKNLGGAIQLAEGWHDPAGADKFNNITELWGNSVGFVDDKGAFHRFSHLDETMMQGLQVGQRISAGTVIGGVGLTGRTTGPHLDHEMRAKDASNRWQLISSEAYRHGIMQFSPNANIAGMGPNVTKVGAAGAPVGGGGAEDASGTQQMQIVIKLEQDEDGNITGKIKSPPNAVIAFNKQDALRGQFQSSFKLNPVVGAIVGG
jgi:murein DD-endopeptidase MepM/ murein hydrolase activator NlpD